MIWDNEVAREVWPRLMGGLQITVKVTLLATAIALLFGLLLAMLQRSRRPAVRRVSYWVLESIRRTPLLIQLFFAFYVLPEMGIMLDGMVCGVIVLGLHVGSYMAEVYRAGIDAVPKGQWEAARALNLTPRATWVCVILPQAIPPMVPALGNYFVMMFKESALLSTIAVLDLMGEARLFANETYRYIEPMTLVGLIFLAISIPSAIALRYLENRIAKSDRLSA
ncbi:MAG TPA: ectoine/hydroxyectoine ABC transporter permease subunit EhuD [Alicycliphilus denitrificans]|jgi:polar amino acid transport system permease protein|nr:ectoine/hydroxyectoine ABC transporter permease subunit EhuD [Alicycliphilus denitrificans]